MTTHTIAHNGLAYDLDDRSPVLWHSGMRLGLYYGTLRFRRGNYTIALRLC